uniref:BRISC and BRCA1-A complex member 1 n=1 Tax=Clastoptera arizonana TaxID=38151 RepID=A0A1B6CFU4_9HEMI
MPVLCNMALTEESTNSEELHILGESSDQISEPDSDGTDSLSNSSPDVSLPKVAVPEKIILCIDISLDKDCGSYLMKNSKDCLISRLLVLKEALKIFLMNKISLQKNVKFALVAVEYNSVKWISDFKSELQEIILLIDNLISNSNVIADGVINYELTPLFQTIQQNIIIPAEDCPSIIPSSEVYRAILIYNSSKCIPQVNLEDDDYIKLMSSPYFVLDILYLHDSDKGNECQNIFHKLAFICKNTSYIFEVPRSVLKVYNSLAKLLSHPFQRAHLQELF